MPELTGMLTDDQGRITHLITEEEERLSVEELASKLSGGEDYYITFGEEQRYPITIIAEDGGLEPTIDDPDGEHTIWDLPQEEDPEEREIPEMFDELENMGEFDDKSFGSTSEHDFGSDRELPDDMPDENQEAEDVEVDDDEDEDELETEEDGGRGNTT